MDFFSFDNLKAEKAGAMLWYNYFHSLTKLFRFIELSLALLFLSWFSNRLPFAVQISAEFFRRAAGVISSPIFVFFVSNAIIAALILKSGRFSGENPAADYAETDFYEELLKKNENRCSKTLSENPPPQPHLSPDFPSHATEEIEIHDKEIILAELNDDDDIVELDLSPVSISDSESDSDTPRAYRRSKSERKLSEKVSKKKLRRSETEKYINVTEGESLIPEHELSDKEFQRTVDEFIAKHLKLRRQESLSIVVQNQSSV